MFQKLHELLFQEFFGPYLSGASVKMALKSIRKIWPFRDCSQNKYDSYAKLGHGCIFATLKLCDAPCAAKISQEDYRQNIDQIRAFLRGDREKLLKLVQSQMEEASQNENYEMAAKYRDRLQSLLQVQEVAVTRKFYGQQQTVAYQYNPERDLRVECYDISNISGSHAVGSQIVGIIREGKITPATTREEARQQRRNQRGHCQIYSLWMAVKLRLGWRSMCVRTCKKSQMSQ